MTLGKRSLETRSYCSYHVLLWWHDGGWRQQLLWGSNHSGHDTVVECSFFLSSFLQGLFGQINRGRCINKRSRRQHSKKILLNKSPLVFLRLLLWKDWCFQHVTCHGCRDSSRLELCLWIVMEQLTQPVASNILRSSGSPDSWPSILVREWQVAIHATNRDLTRFSL